MKTGFTNEPDHNEMLSITTLLTLFSEDAMNIASIYTLHSGRKVVSGKDTIMGLQARAIYAEKFWELPDVLERCQKIREELTKDEEEILPDENGIIREEPWKKSECNCIVCQYINSVPEKWSKWEPKTIQDQYIKFSIDKTIKDVLD